MMHREKKQLMPLFFRQYLDHRFEFIPLSFWYDAPLTSPYSDRRHDPCQVYRRGARPPSNIGQQPIGREWMSYPYPPETWATIGPGGHENTLGGDTGEWCG